jgi:hypothetical protein
MTIAGKAVLAALTCLAEWYPKAFTLEKHLPHQPLKVGIAADIPARCPDLDRRVRGATLAPTPGASCICKAW